MKNFEMKFLVENGILNLTSHNLEAAHAYKVVQFKNRMRNAVEALGKTQQGLVGEAGITEPEAFDARREELAKKEKRTKSEEAELKDMNDKLNRLNELTNALMMADAEIEPKTMPYEQFKALQDENKDIKAQGIEILTLAESQLEGILWKAPEE